MAKNESIYTDITVNKTNSISSYDKNKSQSFKSIYHVENNMHQKDISNGVYHDEHYDKNPTAKNLNDIIHGNYIGDKRTNIEMPYVITLSGDVIIGKRNGNGKEGLATPHPTLIGGKDPQVTMAGMLHIQGGKIASYDNKSECVKKSL